MKSKLCRECGYGERNGRTLIKNNNICTECEKFRLIYYKYGLTREQYYSLIQYGCAICGSTDKLRVDHHHVDGYVRGALCSACNTGLGNFKDNPVLLVGAIRYLEDRGSYGDSDPESRRFTKTLDLPELPRRTRGRFK